ncbi:hypothetical protein [Bacillus subtilis]|uniref:hypothetical protein n=1 Tax=Bacillus subtilis TaxID=1423 RepID=UPI0021AD905D|nr:hypothetical protein [Bacillus subtilis]
MVNGSEEQSKITDWLHNLMIKDENSLNKIDIKVSKRRISEQGDIYREEGEYIENADLQTLPIGTKFFVQNGCWKGEIVSVNEKKHLYMPQIGEMREIKVGSTGLNIEIE